MPAKARNKNQDPITKLYFNLLNNIPDQNTFSALSGNNNNHSFPLELFC